MVNYKDRKHDATRTLVLNATKKIYLDGVSGTGSDTYIVEAAADDVQLKVGNQFALRLTETGDLVDVVLGHSGALATNATAGFVSIPSCAGTPTGTPSQTPSGKAQIVYDSTNNKLYVYDGAWTDMTA